MACRGTAFTLDSHTGTNKVSENGDTNASVQNVLRTTICNPKANTAKTCACHTDSGVISRTLVVDSHLTSSIRISIACCNTLPHRSSSHVFVAILSALKMETVCLFKTLVSTDVFTRRHNPEVHRHSHRHENLKTRILSRHQLRLCYSRSGPDSNALS
jgi:hypothetical protein